VIHAILFKRLLRGDPQPMAQCRRCGGTRFRLVKDREPVGFARAGRRRVRMGPVLLVARCLCGAQRVLGPAPVRGEKAF
jgi:hypothetical protein